jgi:hypothetical protein
MGMSPSEREMVAVAVALLLEPARDDVTLLVLLLAIGLSLT